MGRVSPGLAGHLADQAKVHVGKHTFGSALVAIAAVAQSAERDVGQRWRSLVDSDVGSIQAADELIAHANGVREKVSSKRIRRGIGQVDGIQGMHGLDGRYRSERLFDQDFCVPRDVRQDGRSRA